MLTRQGMVSIAAGVAAIVVGRLFGVLELFVIGAGFLVAVVLAVLYVRLRTPPVVASRWIHPSVLVAGDTGRVDITLRHHSPNVRSARFTLLERVARHGAPDHVARLTVEPMAPDSEASAGYQLPTTVRGLIHLGPLVAEVRDPLGIAQRERAVAGVDVVTVAPRAHLVDIPELGSGRLGRHLLALARRLGPGEFHSLREYADGDEPRSIHWRASARSDDLLVKQHTVQGLRRMLVVLDANAESYADSASFERAITVAASMVRSASTADLNTRFVTGGGVDLRGPDVTEAALRLLAQLTPTSAPFAVLDRDPGEGVGLLVAITGSTSASGWRAVQSVIDPTLTTVPITTDEAPRRAVAAAARTEDEFLRSWSVLAGRRSVRSGRPREVAV